jgi:putative membrane protein
MARVHSMSEADRQRVSEAVHAAEGATAGEIVTIVSRTSDWYLDVALWWSVIVGVLALAALAAFPAFYTGLVDQLAGEWISDWTLADALELALAVFVIKFVAMRLLLQWMRLRLILTPKRVKANRVRRRALRYFKVGAESRTSGRTGILIYLSLAERMAEIVADDAIHSAVAPEVWGEAMAHLVAEVREGRIADGMIAAVSDVGAILATHFPRSQDDVNELPDRLIEL